MGVEPTVADLQSAALATWLQRPKTFSGKFLTIIGEIGKSAEIALNPRALVYARKGKLNKMRRASKPEIPASFNRIEPSAAGRLYFRCTERQFVPRLISSLASSAGLFQSIPLGANLGRRLIALGGFQPGFDRESVWPWISQ